VKFSSKYGEHVAAKRPVTLSRGFAYRQKLLDLVMLMRENA
jgi:hypothetical protein